MNGFGLRIGLFLMLVINCFGCREEVDIFTSNDYLPVVYGIYCPDDSVINIKISRTFQGNQSAFITATDPDTQFLKSLKVTIEFVSLKGQLYLRQDVPLVCLQEKEPGIFYTNPNYQFFARTSFPYTVWNSPYHAGKLRVVIFDPILDRYTVGESIILGNPKIVGPKNPLGHFSASMYSESPFNVWYVDVKCAYTIQVQFYYLETNTDGVTSKKMVSWDIPIEYLGGDYLNPDEQSLERLTIGGDDFYRNLGRLIDNKTEETRQFQSFSIVLFAYDPIFRTYEDVNKSELDIDPRLISNITNGMGVFACSRKTSVDSLRLDQKSLDSLCSGKFTRLLNFQKW